MKSFIDRFWSRINFDGKVVTHVSGLDPCWEWQGAKRPDGYGNVNTRSNRVDYAHRIAWMLAHGDPGDLLVLHACDNRLCCNPNHLFIGTYLDNNRDCIAKGRGQHHNSYKTHCPHGHSYSGTNVVINSNGSRECKTCNRERHRCRRERIANGL